MFVYNFVIFMQPESPAQLGGKIYEMMGMALSGKWGTNDISGFQQDVTAADATNLGTVEAEVVEPVEAEVVEPAEAGSQK